MAQVRLLVGTRKGGFILTADGTRRAWDVAGPFFAGWEIYHLKGSPADLGRIYASQSSSWFGQVIQRSDDGGRNWTAMSNELHYDGVPGTHQWYDGTPHPWEFKRVWHIEPSLTSPDELYAGVEDAALRTDDAGESWHEISGNLPTDFGFVIDIHAHEPDTIYVVPIKSDAEHFPLGGQLRVYRSRSGGNDWEPLTEGLPQSNCFVNVLRDAMAVDTLEPCGIYFGTTGGQVYASADAGDSWTAVVRDLPAVLSVEVQTLP
jgi:photosystem II stability/assembly factor-like uncharacterized protein